MQPDTIATERNETDSRDLPEFLTVAEFQHELRVGKDLAYQLAQQHGVRLGRLLRVPRAVLEELARGKQTV